MATTRRTVIASAFAGLGVARSAPVSPKDNLKITKLETFLVKPRWLFLKIHTDAGIVGLGEPVLEGRARTCAEAVKEIEPYLVGKDPRRVVHHWQAIYRHAFYRGGPILTSALSGIDQALWDIKGKALGVPVYELLGGPTRDRVRVYAHAGTPEADQGTRWRRASPRSRPARPSGGRRAISRRRPRWATPPSSSPRCASAVGDDVDIGIDFHGAISPAHGEAADQGAGALPADVHRRAVPGAEPRRDGRDRARHAPAHRHRRARLHQVGLPRGAGKARGHRSCSPTCATPAASPKCG